LMKLIIEAKRLCGLGKPFVHEQSLTSIYLQGISPNR
jgi:hypothetical protein